jgi:DNA-binding response OmpR family regulator
MIRRRIFLVDDDADLRKTLMDQLMHYREFELIEAATGNDAIRKVRDGHVDLMLLDVGLPDMDGLESGANDYVTKPFRFSVLLARIRAALRQHDQSEDVIFTIGPYSFQPANKLLEASDGGKVRLTDKETSILKYLYRQGPKTITRDVLLKEVWGYNNRVTTHTLETHIYRLRQKIERDPSNARLLVTEEGGYRLVP